MVYIYSGMFSFRKSLRRYGGKESIGKKSSSKKAKKSSGKKGTGKTGTGKTGKGKKRTLPKKTLPKKTRPKKTQKKQKIKGNYPKKKATAKKAKKARKTMPMPEGLDLGVMMSIMQNMDNPKDASKFARAFTKRAPRGMEVAEKLRILKEYGDYEYDGDFSYFMIHPFRNQDVMEEILSIVYEFDVVNLDIKYDLKELPSNIGLLSNLIELELVTPNLTRLPPSLANLHNLRLIKLEGDPAEDRALPNSILDQICSMLGGLTRLYVSSCGFTQIPGSISNLRDLETLSIIRCPMDEYQVTPAIGSLTKLTELMLVDMNLRSLPEEIGNLTNLQELYAYKNQLDSLPESFENLTNLTTLDLDKNRFNNDFPHNSSGLSKLTNLQKLLLRDNPITVLPQSIQELIDSPGSRITRDNVHLDIDLPVPGSDQIYLSGTDGESDLGSEDSVVSEADDVLVPDSDSDSDEPLGLPPTVNPFPIIHANAQQSYSSSEELG